MTIKEVASIFQVNEDTIQHHVRNLYPGLMVNGKKTYLNEEQVTRIKERMQPTKALVGAVTDLEMEEKLFQVMSWQKAKIDAIKKELEDKTLRLENIEPIYNNFLEAKNSMTVGEFAKSSNSGLGQKNMFILLRENKILMNNNIPYQEYIDRGYFEVKQVTKNTYNFPTTFVTPKGAEWLSRNYL